MYLRLASRLHDADTVIIIIIGAVSNSLCLENNNIPVKIEVI